MRLRAGGGFSPARPLSCQPRFNCRGCSELFPALFPYLAGHRRATHHLDPTLGLGHAAAAVADIDGPLGQVRHALAQSQVEPVSVAQRRPQFVMVPFQKQIKRVLAGAAGITVVHHHAGVAKGNFLGRPGEGSGPLGIIRGKAFQGVRA